MTWSSHYLDAFLELPCQSLSTIATTPQHVDSPHSSNVALPVTHRRRVSAAIAAGFHSHDSFTHNLATETTPIDNLTVHRSVGPVCL